MPKWCLVINMNRGNLPDKFVCIFCALSAVNFIVARDGVAADNAKKTTQSKPAAQAVPAQPSSRPPSSQPTSRRAPPSTPKEGAEQLAEWHITQACNLMKANDPSYVDSGRAHLTSAVSIGKGTPAGVKAERFLKHNWPRLPVPQKIVKKHTDAVKVSESSESERLWRECIKQCPTFEHPYNGLGQQLLKQGNPEGETLLKKVLKLNPDYVRPYIRLASVEVSRKNPKKAAEYLMTAIKMNPFDWAVERATETTEISGFTGGHFILMLEKERDAARRAARKH